MRDHQACWLTEVIQVASDWLAVMKRSFVYRSPITDQFVRRARRVLQS